MNLVPVAIVSPQGHIIQIVAGKSTQQAISLAKTIVTKISPLYGGGVTYHVVMGKPYQS